MLARFWTPRRAETHYITLMQDLQYTGNTGYDLDVWYRMRHPHPHTHSLTLPSALKAMRERNTGSVLVTSDGQAQGIFTERDYLTKVHGHAVNVL